jgi:hypothetical protein
METPEDLDLEDDFDGEDGDGLGDYIRDLVSPWSDGLYGHENEDDKDGTIWAELQESGYNEEPLSAVVTTHLRAVLSDLVEKNADKMGGEVAEALRRWTEDANAEGLAEWLGKGGWDLVDADKVEARLNHAAEGVFSKRVETTLAFDCENGMGGEWIKHVRAAFGLGSREDFSDLERDFPRWAEISKTLDGVTLLRGLMVEVWVRPKVWTICLLNVPRSAQTPERNAAWLESGGYEKPLEVLVGLDALRFVIQKRAWLFLEDFLQPQEKKFDWFRLLALAWMDERAGREAERLERQKTAAELDAAPRVNVKGRSFGRVPKVLAGMSWAMGAPGVELSRVNMDGREYAPAPDLAIQNPSALVPTSYALLPEDHARKPHQAVLPIDQQGGEDAPPLPVALAGATQYALKPAAGKLGLLVMAAAWAGKGRLHKTTLQELTRAINPEARLAPSHYETVLRGLVQLDGLRLVLPNGFSYPVFECPIPWRNLRPEEYVVPLYVGMTRTFEKTLAAIAQEAGTSYRGDFLFDLTGAMLLPTKRSGLLRQYIRSCAFWNSYWKPGTAGEPDPSRVPEVSAERWAAMTNYLPPTAVEYLRAKRKAGDRRSLSASIKDTLKDAEDLAAAGLVKIDKANRHSVRLLPPPEYLEAWHESRKGAHKMPGRGGKA